MPRAKSSVVSRNRHKKILKLAKGYRGSKSKLFRVANQQVMKSLSYAYRDRKNKKRDFRRLWIARINAAARNNGMSYNRFMNGLKNAGVDINRKVLADLAVNDGTAFGQLVSMAKDNAKV
ncbi:MAG: 50S ribosomal protein L20 [Desulfotomaculaceae bacterium]